MSNTAQRNFAGGEIAPALYGRTDATKYQTGLRSLRNMIVQRHGGVTNRPGTEFINEVKDSTKTVRLIRFAFSTAQTYMLEFGDHYMRVIRLGAQIVVSGIAAYNGATNYVLGDLVLQGGINYYCILATVGNAPPNATYWYPLTGVIYEIPTPYGTADLPDLQYVQSADVLTIVHPSYPPAELRRTAHTNWTLIPIVFTPPIGITILSAPTGAGGGHNYGWAVTAIIAETGEEGLPAYGSVLACACTVATPVDMTWTAVPGVLGYNVYRATFPTIPFPGGFVPSYNFVGSVFGTAFRDDGTVTPDPLVTPPIARNPFVGAGNYPAVVGFCQQRRIFAQTINDPEKVWLSRTGHYNNFTVSFPVQDDDAVTFNLSGRQINAVKHLIDIGKLVVFTEDGEWLIDGDVAGIIRPGEINPHQISYYGSNNLNPVIIGDAPIFVQARGTKVRDFKPSHIAHLVSEYEQGNDITVYAAHMFDGYTLADMDFQENPHSVMWVVRSDGVLLGLTYMPDQAVWGWHRHDTDGAFENVCVIPEGAEDKLYCVVRRTIQGVTRRYIERLSARFFTDIRNVILMDAALSYDGRNTGATTMTLSGGVNWDSGELLTVTAGVFAPFVPGDVGNGIFFYDALGNEIRFTIQNYVSAVIVTGFVSSVVPLAMRNAPQLVWSKAVKSFSGLLHLEGKNLACIGDGFVMASPNNASYALMTVVGGSITLDRPYVVVHAGLPYISDFETLDIDSATGPSLKESKFLVNKVRLLVEKTRGIWAGRHPPANDILDPLQNLSEVKPRSSENPALPPQLITDDVSANISSAWDPNGRIFVRQVDPVPLTILVAIPQGYIP